MSNYNPKEIEPRWQKYWEEKGLYKTPENVDPAKKMYILPQLPYPSGSGLHVGHAEVYTACDIYARYQRMVGRQVLQVIGWDSFGLPAENYAIKTNVHPRKSTDDAVNNFRSQIKALGISVDWDREVGSHNADYYKWTQWFFLLMYKRGLAYRKKQAVNWCDSCKTVLANEQVTNDGKCERCDTVVEQRQMEQWYLKITDYADRLDKDLEKIDWPEETKRRQKNWIGKSEGALIKFPISNFQFPIEVFTTRPDTIFGATYLVVAPEHELVQNLKSQITNFGEAEEYIAKTKLKTELDRQVDQDKTGVELKGVKAINPVSGEEIPVWIADYVLATYGTGAIMAVPAHDERDFAFAQKFGLSIREVVAKQLGERSETAKFMKKVRGVCVRDGKMLLSFDKDMQEYVLPGGTVDEGEEFEEALKREIREETGYTDTEITGKLGTLEHNYFHHLLKSYRQAKEVGFVCNVTSDNVVDRPQEEIDKIDFGWFPIEEAVEKLKNSPTFTKSVEFVERFLNKKGIPFTESGVSINSDFLNGLPTAEAKEKIIQYLEEKGIGQRKIQFKLRDWSVSRQRFWGAPIPMVYSEKRRNKKRHYILIHGFTGSGEVNFFPWLKQKLEAEGHTVFCPNLPNTNEPSIDEQVDHILANTSLDEDTVVLGHSLGGVVAMRLLDRTGQKVAKVVFVDSFHKPEFADKKRPNVEKSVDWKFDFAKIKSLSDEFVLLRDDRYETIPQSLSEEMRKIFDARIITIHPVDEHFCAVEEPTVFEHALVDGFLTCGMDDMPVKLPDDVDFKPTGQSPLTYSEQFQMGVEEKYGLGFRREVDTLDTFMCSSWYYYRYLDPKNDEVFASPEALKTWMPVDFYLGGEEHVNGHLLYSRFFTKVLYDAGYINFDEPFAKHRHQGLILGEDSRKMSKRWGNVINPTDVIAEYGADTIRIYEMFMGPLEQTKPWSTHGVKGVRRFLDRVWSLQGKLKEESASAEVEKILHQTIKKVGEDLAGLQFNTAVAKMMELTNALMKEDQISKDHFALFLQILSPFAPHISEEMWSNLGNSQSITLEPWPTFDEAKIQEDEMTLAVQVNGKVRATLTVSTDISSEEAQRQALALPNVEKWLDGATPKKVIYVPGKLISIVV